MFISLLLSISDKVKVLNPRLLALLRDDSNNNMINAITLNIIVNLFNRLKIKAINYIYAVNSFSSIKNNLIF